MPSPLYFIDNGGVTDARRNLALEEICLRRLDMNRGMYLLFYVNEPAIIIGRNQNTIEEINADYVKEHGIAVVRRISGGGAVYHDLGNLNFSFLTRYDKQHLNNFRLFTEPVIAALKELGVPAELVGRNDIQAGGRKISGNAQFSTGKSMLSHGTLLLDSDLDTVVRALDVKLDKVASKGLKSVRARVANITEFLSAPLTMAAFRRHILEHVFADHGGVREFPLPEDLREESLELAETKYGGWDWNFGRSPEFNIQRVHRFDIGQIDARLDVRNGRIRHIRIFGDFLGHGDIGDVEARLNGLRYERGELAGALAGLDMVHYFGGLSADDLAAFLAVA